MNLLTKARLLSHVVKWRLTWDRRNLSYREPGINHPKFMTAREAVALIPDGVTVASACMAANHRPSVFYWAIQERFRRTGRPKDLTWIVVGAHGGRGRAPGTIEELALPGLITRLIGGHLETCKANLKLAQQGLIELHTMSQGEQTFLLEGQARGEDSILTETGIGTFLDTRVGNGTGVNAPKEKSFVTPEGDKLRFRLPKVELAVFIAPYADREGNIYFRHGATYTEAREVALAAKANGGKVLVSVAGIVPKDDKSIFLPADKVDAIVVHPLNEQTGSVPQLKYWPMFTVGGNVDIHEAVAQLKFYNNVLKITPVRSPAELALGRMAARLFTRVAHKGAYVNIGVGLPEEVCRLVYEGGLTGEVNFLSETGVLGGLPTPGIFFGACINPKQMMSSAEIFHFCYEKLDVTILGMLQADSDGNVNVSKRGEGPINYVGPGGFPNLSDSAKTVIIVGSWMAHADMTIRDGKLQIRKPGTYKFIERVDEITFNGRRAAEKGKNVFYCTNIGIFKLTRRGMELIEVMPGVDIQRDVLSVCPMKVLLPESGNVKIVEKSIVTGEGFRLAWEKN